MHEKTSLDNSFLHEKTYLNALILHEKTYCCAYAKISLSNFYSHKLRHLHLQPDPGKPELRDLLLERTDMQIVFHVVKGALLPQPLAFHGIGEGFADGCGMFMVVVLV